MAGAFVLNFDVAGEEQVRRGFSRFADDVKDLRPAFREIVNDFAEISGKQFSTEGRYGSGGWAPLSAEYAKWKTKHYPSRPILVLSGRLRESMIGSNETIRDIQHLTLRMGSKVPYALYHQEGTKYMPARKPIQLTDDDKKRWTKYIHTFLVQSIDRGFSGAKGTELATQTGHLRSI